MENPSVKYQQIRLGDWKGLAACCNSDGIKIDISKWTKEIGKVSRYAADGDEVLKDETGVRVIKRHLDLDTKPYTLALKFVIKPSSRSFLRGPKVVNNFKTAANLIKMGIKTAWPLMAVSRSKANRTESLYITEYIEKSENLYWFTVNNSEMLKSLRLKSAVERKITEIFALLYKSGLWHRDAKASNIMIKLSGNGLPEVFLVDLDGIKSHGVNDKNKLLARSVGKLGSTLMWSRLIGRTDACRIAKYLKKDLNLDTETTRKLSIELMSRSVAERLMTMTSSEV